MITSIHTNKDNNTTDGSYYYHDGLIKDAIDSSEFPTTIKPMLATLIDKPFDNKDWVFEAKWDGVRAIFFAKNKRNLKNNVS
jgi:ATP-dependent DNA ligase